MTVFVPMSITIYIVTVFHLLVDKMTLLEAKLPKVSSVATFHAREVSGLRAPTPAVPGAPLGRPSCHPARSLLWAPLTFSSRVPVPLPLPFSFSLSASKGGGLLCSSA